jgi:hypothetical protein
LLKLTSIRELIRKSPSKCSHSLFLGYSHQQVQLCRINQDISFDTIAINLSLEFIKHKTLIQEEAIFTISETALHAPSVLKNEPDKTRKGNEKKARQITAIEKRGGNANISVETSAQPSSVQN